MQLNYGVVFSITHFIVLFITRFIVFLIDKPFQLLYYQFPLHVPVRKDNCHIEKGYLTPDLSAICFVHCAFKIINIARAGGYLEFFSRDLLGYTGIYRLT